MPPPPLATNGFAHGKILQKRVLMRRIKPPELTWKVTQVGRFLDFDRTVVLDWVGRRLFESVFRCPGKTGEIRIPNSALMAFLQQHTEGIKPRTVEMYWSIRQIARFQDVERDVVREWISEGRFDSVFRAPGKTGEARIPDSAYQKFLVEQEAGHAGVA